MVAVAVKPEPTAAGNGTKKKKLYKSSHGKRNKPKPKAESTDLNGKISDIKIIQEKVKKVKSPITKKSQSSSKFPKKNKGKTFKNANWAGTVAVEEDGFELKEEEFDIKEEIQDNTINSTTPDSTPVISSEEAKHLENFKFLQSEATRTRCLEFEGKWSFELPDKSRCDSASLPPSLISKIKKYTDNLFDLEVKNYERKSKGSKGQGDNLWMKQVLKSGTMQDKISTFIVQIQSSPLHSIAILDKLISFLTLKCRRNCYLAIDALLNIFETDLLITDMKLTPFEKQPFQALQQLSKGNSEARDDILLIWMLEHKIKFAYSRFLAALSEINKDVLEKTKMKVMYVEQKLLRVNPEAEQILLERLVSRFGEPLKGVASKAMLYLRGMLEENPVMQGVVVKEVERLLYRDNISDKAKYYCICFLSQLMFENGSQEDVAGRVIVIYFSFFDLTVKKGEVETKIMSSLLTGVNRAFPFTSMNNQEMEEKIETIYKLVYLVSFNISVQALSLLFQILGSRKGLTDRFYTALYKKILYPELESSSKKVLFFNLLFNSMKRDTCVERVRSFIKRMLQASECFPANCAAGIMFIISEVLKARKDIDILLKVATEETGAVDLSRFDYSDDDDDEHFNDIEDDESNDQIKGKAKSSTTGVIFRKKSDPKSLRSGYDPLQRNPMYAHADKAAYWEFSSLLRHFHPSVGHFAKQLCKNEPIVYPGDPLMDFTLIKFLERFSFKNPKKAKELGEVSVFARKRIYKPTGIKTIKPGSEEYMTRYADNMPEDEKFLYSFFLEKQKRKDDKKSEESDEDNESLDSDIDDDYIDRMDVDFSQGLKEMAEANDPDLGEESDDSSDEDEEVLESEDSEPELDEDDAGFKDLSSSDDDDDEDDEDSSQEDGGGNKKKIREEDIEFSNDDDDDDEPPKKKSKKKEKKKITPKKPKYDIDSYALNAESFGEMLETNKESGMGSSYVIKGKPVSARQLKWEQKTEELMRGRDHWKGGKYKKINRFKKMGKNKVGKKKK